MTLVQKSKYKRYPAYKDSGVEWLGDIPEGWKTYRFRNVFSFSKGLNITKENLQEEGIPCVNYGEVHSKYGFEVDPQKHELKCVEHEYLKSSPKSILEFGDFIFADTSEDIEGSGNFTFLNSREIVFAGYHTVIAKPKNEFRQKYTAYLFDSITFRIQIRRNVKGVKVYSITNSILKNTILWFPPNEIRKGITNFLDNKTTKIDQAIAQKEKLIELLKERKQILIQNAVTKGLNPNAKMKDSGVEWIGEIPEHWEVKKLFGICRFVRGNSSFSKDELLSKGEYVAIQYGKSYKVNEIDKNYEFYVNDEFYKSSQIVNYGDTILISTSETIEDLGHSAFYKRYDLGLLGGEQMLLKPKKHLINSKYLHLSSKVFSKELRKYSTGIKVFRFNINDLKTIYTPVPPTEEQMQIVSYIETQSTKIDRAITLQQTQIEKLKEYKATLIDSAVTGKIKVSEQ